MRKLLFLTLFLLVVQLIKSEITDYAVQVSAEIQENPAQIIFSWESDIAVNQYYIFRKAKTDTIWGLPIATLDGNSTQFIDNDIVIGEAYEYGFYKNLNYFEYYFTVPNEQPMTFTIYDSWSDGIADQHGIGFYKISGEEEVYASGGIFGASETTSFLTNNPNSEFDQIKIQIQLDVFGEETTWELINAFTNEVVATGGPYESPKFGHIYSGIKVPVTEHRGGVILLIDDLLEIDLQNEINLFEKDLICDGWKIYKQYVNRNDDVQFIKNLLSNIYFLHPDITSLIIIGHVPVPYSGDTRGAHSDHQGAWPADVYYGEFDGIWTDETVNNTTATRPANHNIPGDGKFDQTILPSDIELQIGRIDLYDLPLYIEDEIQLMRRYFEKNHAFRYKDFSPELRGMYDDNVGDAGGLAFAANALRNFTPMFGRENVESEEYFDTLTNESYLWSYGCGPSGYTNCGGVGSTGDFALSSVQSVFTMLYGSYFGDWDNTNNILRAPLAARGYVLTNSWTGAPNWHLHHMALGETIGYSAKISQNNVNLYAPSDKARQTHTALMGDPTLRMHIIDPPENLSLNQTNNTINLNWGPSNDEIEGYYIYRSDNLYNDFIRISDQIILNNSYTDNNPLEENNVYIVKAIKLENTASGSYYNLSQGIVDSVFLATSNNSSNKPQLSSIKIYPNPISESDLSRDKQVTIQFTILEDSEIEVKIYNIKGQIIRDFNKKNAQKGLVEIRWDGKNSRNQICSSGMYFIQVKTEYSDFTKKLINIQ